MCVFVSAEAKTRTFSGENLCFLFMLIVKFFFKLKVHRVVLGKCFQSEKRKIFIDLIHRLFVSS